MTSVPTPAASRTDAPTDPQIQARLDAEGLHAEGLDAVGLAEPLHAEGLHAEGLHAEGLDAEGLSAVLDEATGPACARVVAHLADPKGADSRAAYAAWLRRQASAWSQLALPAVSVAALDWPLASVRPQCLDVVGLLIADLREIAPRTRPTVVPAQATRRDLPEPGVTVGAVHLCVRLAAAPAPLLPQALGLTAGLTHTGSATRYLARCADLADRAAGLAVEIDRWGGTAGPVQSQLAVLTARQLAERLADALDARASRGW